ncbi:MAG TPA: glycosyltransferase family 4 protein [Candidatus Methylomirabilis sp.]|nr:glycosyltransferase family 4 protein [Candidatus Methylomirabilis sp.]
MRVLYWVQRFWPHIGGVEVHSAQFLRAMRERGFELTVLTSPGDLDLPAVDSFEGIPVHRMRFEAALSSGDPARIAGVRRGIIALRRALRPDLVHLHLTDPSVFFHLITRHERPCPTLLSLRVMLEGDLDRDESVLSKSLSAAEWITTNSAAVLTDLHARRPETTGRSSVIHNGLEPAVFAPTPLGFSPPTLVLLGRLVRDKGFDLALYALADVTRRHPATRMIVAGDGPARPELESLIAELGLGERVELRGWVEPERVPALINEATLVVVPSRWPEAFGLVALQAAQQARPVVAARVGGLPEVVTDGESGVLFEREDHAELARAIVRLLDDPRLAIRFGETGRRLAGERFGWEQHLDAYGALYQRFAGERR